MRKISINLVVTFLFFYSFTIVSIADAKEHIVNANSGKASEMRFEPQDITISPGDMITWVNTSNTYHNVKALKNAIPKGAEPLTSKGLKKKDDRWSHVFTVPGKYDYFCVPHRGMGMVGSVTVTE